MTIFTNKRNFYFDTSGNSTAIFIKNNNYVIKNKTISELISLSKKRKNADLRICMHFKKQDKLHNMIVLINKKNLQKKHKHKNKDEIYQIIYGSIKLEIFGRKKRVFYLSKNKNFIFRVNQNIFHRVSPVGKYAIFHEIRLGPFKKNDSIFKH